jgi:hypothetical protein
MDELSVLSPDPASVAYQGKTLEIVPMKVGQIPAFTRALRPALTAIADISDAIAPGGQPGAGQGTSSEQIVELIADHGDTFVEAVAVATGQAREFIADGTLEEFVDALLTVVRVNADFFARAVVKVEAGLKRSST